MIEKAKKLLYCLGDMDDNFIEEAENVKVAAHKKVIKYSAIGIAAAGGLVLAYKLLKPKLTA